MESRTSRFKLPRLLRLVATVGPLLAGLIILFTLGSLPLVFLMVGLLFLLTYSVRRGLSRRMLGRHRGRVCPCCWRSSDNPRPRCAGCQDPGGQYAHRVYWRIARLQVVLAEQWFGDRYRAVEQRPPATRTFKLMIGVAIFVPVLCVLYIVIATAVFNDLGWMGAGVSSSWIWLLILPGGWVTAYYARRRIGSSLHCAKCEYQLVPNAPTPIACPECGALLADPQSVAQGRRYGNNVVAYGWVIAIALFVPGVILLSSFQGGAVSPNKLVPTASLVAHVTTHTDIEYGVWTEIESRPLDDAVIGELLVEINRRMQQRNPRYDEEDRWFWRTSSLIVDETKRRKLSHQNELIMLRMHKREDNCPSAISLWVYDAIDNGVFTPQEIRDAESGR